MSYYVENYTKQSVIHRIAPTQITLFYHFHKNKDNGQYIVKTIIQKV